MSFSLSSRSPEPSTFSASGVAGIGLSLSLIVRVGGVRIAGAGCVVCFRSASEAK
jgi:hypothetical protein